MTLALCAWLGTGCSAKVIESAPPTITPATAAVAPPTSAEPAGRVIAQTGALTSARFNSAVFDAGTRSLACLSHTELAVLDRTGAMRTITLPEHGSAVAGDGDGRAFVAVRGGILTVDIAGGAVTRSSIAGHADTEFTAIARHPDGRLVIGSADGVVLTLAPDQSVLSRAYGFARVDGIATAGERAVVLDSAQTSVTELDADGDPGLALRAGLGATRMAADPAGRVLVTDTRAGQLLVFGVDPLIERQAYPVPGAPFGVAGSARLTWVSQTADNSVVGYDLATGIPIEKVRYPTVRQPDSLAVDDSTDTLYVVSGSGAGVQVIRGAAGGP